MLVLIQQYGLENAQAFKIMEDVRKGKGLKPEYEESMIAHGVPDWYIASCKKIKYMFPKAHAAAYVMSAIRLGWYKIYYPLEFYAAFLSVAPGGFDVVIDAVGVTPLFQQSLNFAAPRARVACIGFDARPAEIPPVMVTKKELTIVGSRMNCYRFPIVMEWLNDGKIQADKMISRKYSIENIQQAFEETLANSATSVKTLIVFE